MGYVDRILIVVTDSGKMGNLVRGSQKRARAIPSPPTPFPISRADQTHPPDSPRCEPIQILAEKEPTPPMDEVTYSVKPLMGSDMQRDPIPQILARQLVEVISKTDDRPLLLSVVFRKSRNVTRETLRSVLKSIVENCCVWVPVVCSS